MKPGDEKIEERKQILATEIARRLFVDGGEAVSARTGGFSGEISLNPGCVWISGNYPEILDWNDGGSWPIHRTLDAISCFAWAIACAEHGRRTAEDFSS